MLFFLNGSFLTEEEAKISVLDLGLLRGFAVFEYLRTYKQQPFHLKEHLDRFSYSAKKLGLPLPYSFDEIRAIIDELIKRTGFTETSIKLILTGGQSPDQLLPYDQTSFLAFVYPLTFPDKKLYTDGIQVITTTHKRCAPDCKTTQYLPAILALQKAKTKQASDALYLNDKQEILEATTSNFFAIKKGVIITPPENEILIGITREVTLAICQNHFPVEIRSISQKEIPELDEAFITASNKEILPITHIDDFPIKEGKVGPLTQKIHALFCSYTQSGQWHPLNISRYEV